MPKLTVYSIEGKDIGSIDLPESFAKKVNDKVIHQAVVMYQANQRQGTLDTKIRSEISGGNKKPFRQKGTGRARQGSTRSPLMHHGGIVFGPHPRDFGYSAPKKVRTVALRESLNAKFKDDSLVCVDGLTVQSGKTKDFVGILKNLKISGKKTLAIFDDCAVEVARASKNVRGMTFAKGLEVNALDILKTNKVLATKTAMEKILKENPMKTSFDVIKTILRTEKSTAIEKARQYLFRVATHATKTDIKKAVEEAYKVKVQGVNVINVPGKRKRVRTQYGYTADWKKAVVTLKEGSKIEVA